MEFDEEYPNITGEIANLITLDVGMNVPPEKSKRLVYGEEEKRFRDAIQKDWNAQLASNPNSTLHIAE